MTATEMHRRHITEIYSNPRYQCPHGLTGHGMWLAGCADRALAAVTPDSSAEAFLEALERETDWAAETLQRD